MVTTLLLDSSYQKNIFLYIFIYIYIYFFFLVCALCVLGLYAFVSEQFMLLVPYLFSGFVLLNIIFMHASHCISICSSN